MCEIFGYSAKNACEINEYLKKFFSRSCAHPHGWGLACADGDWFCVEKEPVQASKSKRLAGRLLAPVSSRCVLAHIRYATIGNVESKNCHPYTREDRTGRRYVLIHNGTIFDFPPLNKYVKCQEGETDSERILLYIVDKINAVNENRSVPMDGKERFEVIECALRNMARGNKLNIMIFDGENLFVHTNFKDSLFYLKRDDDMIISTEPLGAGFKPFPFCRVMAVRDGEFALYGKKHDNEYFESEEDLRFLYQAFAQL